VHKCKVSQIKRSFKNVEKLRLNFITYRYGGQLSDVDWDKYYEIKSENKSIGEWINYLMNKYTINKSKEIVHKSSYNDYSKSYEFKLDKI
jgi:hypothetical protein